MRERGLGWGGKTAEIYLCAIAMEFFEAFLGASLEGAIEKAGRLMGARSIWEPGSYEQHCY